MKLRYRAVVLTTGFLEHRSRCPGRGLLRRLQVAGQVASSREGREKQTDPMWCGGSDSASDSNPTWFSRSLEVGE